MKPKKKSNGSAWNGPTFGLMGAPIAILAPGPEIQAEDLDLEDAPRRILPRDRLLKDLPMRITRRQREILEFVRDGLQVPARETAAACGLSRSTLQRELQPLLAAQIIVREGQTRRCAYRLAKAYSAEPTLS